MRVKLYLQRTQLTISSLEGGGGIPKHRGELLRWHALVRRLEAGEQGAVRHRVTDQPSALFTQGLSQQTEVHGADYSVYSGEEW